MRLRVSAALSLVMALVACDDGTVITHVDKRPHMQETDLVTMQQAGGILVEIHGSPWLDATDEDLARALKPPAGGAQEVRFRAVPPGQWVQGHGHRLVLHFNPTGAPNNVHDCRAAGEMRTRAPADVGFTVNATFCTEDDWVAHGYLQATKVRAGDWDEYSRVMRNLFLAIFREEKDR